MKPQREWYVPKSGYMAVRAKKAEAVVYVSISGKPSAIGFAGKAAKPSFNYIYQNEARREAHVRQFFESVATIAANNAKNRERAKAFKPSLKVGDILSNSWGYDQTNTEFYQVTKLIGKAMCEVRELCCQSEQTGFLSESVVPMPNHFRENAAPMRKRILEGNIIDVHNASFGRASLYHRPEPGKLPIMPPKHVSHTH